MKPTTRILVIGATSAIAQAVCRRVANKEVEFVLHGRHAERLASVAADLRSRGADVHDTLVVDLDDDMSRQTVVDRAFENAAGIDAVLIAHGTLPDQAACEAEMTAAGAALRTNFTATAELVIAISHHLERQGRGRLMVITSVAGDRGRASNWIYGGAKAGISVMLQGLMQKFADGRIAIIDVRPGFIDTPMTRAFRKGLLWRTPDDIAPALASALLHGQSGVIYAPSFWRVIMFILRNLPFFIFKRLKI